MLSFLLLLCVSGNPASPFPARLDLWREYETRRVARRRSDVRKEMRRRGASREVHVCVLCVCVCVCVNPLLSSPCASPLAHSSALNCEDIMVYRPIQRNTWCKKALWSECSNYMTSAHAMLSTLKSASFVFTLLVLLLMQIAENQSSTFPLLTACRKSITSNALIYVIFTTLIKYLL